MHAHMMLPRTVLLCLLCLANHAIYVVEQPRQSLLYAYYRWQWLQNRVSWVSCVDLEASLIFAITVKFYIIGMHAHMLLGTVGVSSVLLADEIRITITKAAHVEKQLALHCEHGSGTSPTQRSS